MTTSSETGWETAGLRHRLKAEQVLILAGNGVGGGVVIRAPWQQE
jgi:hypothetical protein